MDVDGEMNHDTFFNPIMLNLVSEVVHRCAFLSDFFRGHASELRPVTEIIDEI